MGHLVSPTITLLTNVQRYMEVFQTFVSLKGLMIILQQYSIGLVWYILWNKITFSDFGLRVSEVKVKAIHYTDARSACMLFKWWCYNLAVNTLRFIALKLARGAYIQRQNDKKQALLKKPVYIGSEIHKMMNHTFFKAWYILPLNISSNFISKQTLPVFVPKIVASMHTCGSVPFSRPAKLKFLMSKLWTLNNSDAASTKISRNKVLSSYLQPSLECCS